MQVNTMLDYFFNPKGVAVIGATDNKLKGGYHIVRNALAGYKGKVYPVNPRYKEILGIPCYPDIQSIPENFDMAVYFIPAKSLPDTIRACAAKGVKGIIIESAGFSEMGPEGKKLQEESVALAKKHGIRLWGPNCMGYLDGHSQERILIHVLGQMDDAHEAGEGLHSSCRAACFPQGSS